MSSECNITTPQSLSLSDAHLYMLTIESGIAPEVIAERGYSTASTQAELATLGFADFQRRAPALVFPVHDVQGNVALYSIRPDAPRKNKRGKALKYDTPQHAHLALDVLPSQRHALRCQDVPLLVVEGLKKSDSITSRVTPTTPVCTVGVIGTWGWMRDKQPLPDWRAITLQRRKVIIVYDSDAQTVREVQQARSALAVFLAQQGADVHHVDLPTLPTGKCGADDYLIQGHGLADLLALAQETFPRPQPRMTTLTDVQERPVEWLWWPYLAKGTIAMLDGDPGLGKSLLSVQLAACFSRGYPLPDQAGTPTLPTGGPHHVLLITSEDSPEHTIKPRLLQAGGDPAYVHILTGWTDPSAADPTEVQAFTLKDVPILEQALQQYPAALVVIDPLQAYLGKVDMHRSNETRPLMAKLADLARKHNTVILCIRHPSKPGQNAGRAIHRGLGSIDFIGIARTGLNMLPHPTNPTKALLAQGKNNLGPLGRTLIFAKTEGHFTWAGVSRLPADMLASTGYGPDASRLIEACFWLEEQLDDQVPRLAKDIEEAAEEEGIKRETLKRAKKVLGIRSIRSGTFTEPVWHWQLPDLTLLPPPHPEPLQSLASLESLEPLELLRENQPLTDDAPLETPPVCLADVEAVVALEAVEALVGQVVSEQVHPNGTAPPAPRCLPGRVHQWLTVDDGKLCSVCNSHREEVMSP